MPRTFRLARWITALTLPALALPAFAQAAPSPAAVHVAGLLANDARDALRNPDLPPDAAAAEAAVLLECAVRLDGTDLRTLHLLAQTAQAARRTDAQRDALRKIIAADAGDLRAQVDYIDLLATASQNAEERTATYQGALEKTDLDAQVRSEMALRLARLSEGRGDLAACRDYLAQAVKLNSVNIGALRDQVRLAALEPAGPAAFNHHLEALAALLVANPYQADAWLQVARICAAAGAHDRAAEFLQTAIEQYQIDGTPVTLDLLAEMSTELAAADRRDEAYTASAALAQLPDAPLSLLLVAQVLAENDTPGSARPSPAGTQPAFDRAAEIRKQLAEMVKPGGKEPAAADPAALADAAGAALTILATPGPDAAGWVDAYAKMVQPEDPTLARLKGWLLYRQNNLAAAQAELLNATDPLAKVCLARVLIAQGQNEPAGKILQELWDGNPTGLLALQIALAAHQGKLTLEDSPGAKMLRPLIARLTPSLSGMHRHPIDATLILVNYRKPAVGPGEAVPLQVRISNTTDHPLPVGADGMVKTTVGLAAATHGAGTTVVGLYAIEDLQRVYRLEPRQMMEVTIRADQGRLADLLEQNPGGTYAIDVTLITAPRVLSPTEFSAGVGGQAVSVGDFQRGGLPVNAPADLQRLATEAANLTGDRQMIRIEAAGALLAGDKEKNAGLGTALAQAVGSPDPLTRAVAVRAAPAAVPADLAQALEARATDSDPLVRLLWVRRQGLIAQAGGEAGAAAVAALEKRAGGDKDELVKAWLAAALPVAKSMATRPAGK